MRAGAAYGRVEGAAAALRVLGFREEAFTVGKALGMKCAADMAVTEVAPGKQAAALGVAVGERVLAADGRRVATQAAFVAVYQAKLKAHAARAATAKERAAGTGTAATLAPSHIRLRFWSATATE